jgi:hypothetical protein
MVLNNDRILRYFMKSKIDGIDIPENIPVINKEMMTKTIKKLTESWTGMQIGSIVKKKGEDDYYIFLGVIESYDNILDMNDHKLGWFTPYPIKPFRQGYESEIAIFAWRHDLFEKFD